MELPSYFRDFLSRIRPTSDHIDDYKCGHRTLRKRLKEDKTLSPIIVSTFLQGSYRRATAIRPSGDKRADVDIVVVTTLNEQQHPNPGDAMDLFVPFLDEHYKDKYEPQGRSFGIKLSYVELDLVITSAPSESDVKALKSASVRAEETPEDVLDWRLNELWLPPSERKGYFAEEQFRKSQQEAEWKLSPLRIPDRDAKTWEATHPLAQIKWTWEKNRNCKTHYINVVKALKWWRRINHETPKYPKGYPVEHIIGQNCPDGITSVAQGVTLTLEAIAANYQLEASLKITPNIKDHGVDQNVFRRITGEDFAAFHKQVCEAAKIAREALDENSSIKKSAEKWRELFGDKFDVPPDDDDDNGDDNGGEKKGGYTPRAAPTGIAGGRYGIGGEIA